MTEDAIVDLATLVLMEPDHMARLRQVQENYEVPGDPAALFQAQIQLSLMEYVLGELGPEAVEQIRSKHSRLISDARWWHASPEDRPRINAPDRCEHGVEDERRWVCRAGKVVYRD